MLTLPLELVGVGGGSGCWMLGPYCACVSALNKHTGTLATYTYIRVCMRIAISKVFICCLRIGTHDTSVSIVQNEYAEI